MDSHFTIRKWYLDCISDTGDTVILYSAVLSWRGLRTSYCSFLSAQGGEVITRATMQDCSPETEDADAISTASPKLGVTGSWKRLSAPVKRTLLESQQGFVRWNCLMPKADACVNIAGIGDFRGLGYAECLTMTIPPWRLPMTQLRWGRFLSQEDSLAWIDWQGEHSARFSVHNGDTCEDPQISDEKIGFDNKTLSLDLGLTLRSGLLGETVLPSAPLLRNVLPATLFKIDEHKWRSRGTISVPEEVSRSGWSIHEVVRWNQ